MTSRPSERARALVAYVMDNFASYAVMTPHPSQSTAQFLALVREELTDARRDGRVRAITVVIAYEMQEAEQAPLELDTAD